MPANYTLMRRFPLFAALILLALCSFSLAKITYPAYEGYVNDYANVIDEPTEQQITSIITGIEQNTTVEIAVLTVDTLGGQDIEGYSYEVFKQWGVGKKEEGVAKRGNKTAVKAGIITQERSP